MPSRSDLQSLSLLDACLAGDYPLACSLLAAGADPLFFDPARDLDPLAAAARSRSLPLLELLLSEGFFEPGGSSLSAALSESFSKGDLPCSQRLISAGAAISLSALDQALREGRDAFLIAMLERGTLSDPALSEIPGELPRDALFSLCAGHPLVLRACLAQGADIRSPQAADLALAVSEIPDHESAGILAESGIYPFRIPEMARAWGTAFPEIVSALRERDSLRESISSSKSGASPRRGI